jgi:signal transduction histidine kinase
MQALEDGDLVSSLAELAAGTGVGPAVSLHVKGTPRTLPPAYDQALLRMAQEGVANALRHARASKIAVTLDYAPRWVALQVTDDGVGFDASRAASSSGGHFGIVGIRERAKELGGEVTLHSASGQGTTLEVRLPGAP